MPSAWSRHGQVSPAEPSEGARSSVDAALGRVALVLRIIGAVWMVVLATVYGLTGQLDRPGLAVAVTVVGVGWAAVAWATGWMERGIGRGWALLLVDLTVTGVVLIVPAVARETAGFAGGFPFAALVVGVAARGRRGVTVAAVVLSAWTLIALALVGSRISPFVVGQLLLYVFGAIALAMGLDTFRAYEQRARIAESALLVAEERAVTAAHLHDSVLQTLSLVQRQAEDAAAVRTLVRRQERELRDWLFAPEGGPGGPRGGPDELLGRALETHAEDVEARHGVVVRVITVGGAAGVSMGPDGRSGVAALVLAAREAMVNAAVHAGVTELDVFAERSGAEVAVFVRDRGQGFDLDMVPADRQGVRGSIVARMERAGGSAVVRAVPGRGTEVELRVSVPGA